MCQRTEQGDPPLESLLRRRRCWASWSVAPDVLLGAVDEYRPYGSLVSGGQL